jgi:hypothetical protein
MTGMLRKKIGARLRQAREDVGLTQEDVARLLGLTDVGYGEGPYVTTAPRLSFPHAPDIRKHLPDCNLFVT